jgi:hypothetical protein
MSSRQGVVPAPVSERVEQQALAQGLADEQPVLQQELAAGRLALAQGLVGEQQALEQELAAGQSVPERAPCLAPVS